MKPTEIKEEYQTKPNFDGRMQYFNTLGKLMEAYSMANISGDIETTYQSLQTYFYLTATFIKTKDKEKIKELQQAIKANTKNKDPVSQSLVNVQLGRLAEIIFSSTCHLLVPFGSDNDTGDLDDWEGEAEC